MVLTRFPTGGFTVAAVVNPHDEKVVNPTLCIGLIARGVAKGGGAAGARANSDNPIQSGGQIMPLTLHSGSPPDSKSYIHL